ncbi:hypothetical protein ACA910_003944 [Epithemia clementina (nom. ined.)]
MYLHSQVRLNLTRSNVDLTSTEDNQSSVSRNALQHRRQRYRHRHHDGMDNSDDEDKTLAGALAKYQMVHRPPLNEWHDLGKYGGGRTKNNNAGLAKANDKHDKNAENGEEAATVELRIESLVMDNNDPNSGGGGSSSSQTTISYIFQSESGTAIDAFLDQAYQWYLNELRKLDSRVRYLYELKSDDSETDFGHVSSSGGSGNEHVYTRYQLSEEKTFDSLFFREKESLLQLIHHFTAKSGKYSIPGYPHKLGLLLTGCPGSGKTSFIKALAQYTGRSIVNVPLARVRTNAELMSIFYNDKRYVDGEGSIPTRLGFQDVIFVMEDVDAASNVVQRRDKKNKSHNDDDDIMRRRQKDLEEEDILLLGSELPAVKSVWQMLLESNESDCQRLVKVLVEKSPELQEEAFKSNVLTRTLERVCALPGLGLVGSPIVSQTSGCGPDGASSTTTTTTTTILEKIGANALRTANQRMEEHRAVGRFLAEQARLLITRIDQGAQVDDEFVNLLLGRKHRNMSSSPSPPPSPCPDVPLTPPLLHGGGGGGGGDGDDEEEIVETGNLDLSSVLCGNGSNKKNNNNMNHDELFLAKLMAAASSSTTTNTATATPSSTYSSHSPATAIETNNHGTTSHNNKLGPAPPLFAGAFGANFGGMDSFWNCNNGNQPAAKDALNLSGLLNVLDGVVDSPGRIVIMTTNHVEHLDPALIRPGRIDKKLCLGPMAAVDVVAMLEHYFPSSDGGGGPTTSTRMTASQRARIQACFVQTKDPPEPETLPAVLMSRKRQHWRSRSRRCGGGLSMTPAQIEQMTAEYDELEDMIAALEAKCNIDSGCLGDDDDENNNNKNQKKTKTT